VDDAGACEVDDAGAKQKITSVERVGPTVRGPEPMGDNRVHEAGEEGGVDKIGHELGALGDGATGDSGGGNGEGPLVEKRAVVKGLRQDILQAEKVVADETIGGSAKGKGKAEEIIEEATGGSGENVSHGLVVRRQNGRQRRV
jgi:hypothetical protein